jgi:hypothetical protein
VSFATNCHDQSFIFSFRPNFLNDTVSVADEFYYAWRAHIVSVADQACTAWHNHIVSIVIAIIVDTAVIVSIEVSSLCYFFFVLFFGPISLSFVVFIDFIVFVVIIVIAIIVVITIIVVIAVIEVLFILFISHFYLSARFP